MLKNELYIGNVVWNRSKFVKVPGPARALEDLSHSIQVSAGADAVVPGTFTNFERFQNYVADVQLVFQHLANRSRTPLAAHTVSRGRGDGNMLGVELPSDGLKECPPADSSKIRFTMEASEGFTMSFLPDSSPKDTARNENPAPSMQAA